MCVVFPIHLYSKNALLAGSSAVVEKPRDAPCYLEMSLSQCIKCLKKLLNIHFINVYTVLKLFLLNSLPA